MGFVKGKSGNPNGRPLLNLVTLLKQEMERLDIWQDPNTGEASRLSNYEIIAKNLINLAKKDSGLGLMAISQLFDRLYGKAYASSEVIVKEEKRFPDSFYEALKLPTKEVKDE